MKVHRTEPAGLLITEPEVLDDERGVSGIAIDISPGSVTFGRWEGARLPIPEQIRQTAAMTVLARGATGQIGSQACEVLSDGLSWGGEDVDSARPGTICVNADSPAGMACAAATLDVPLKHLSTYSGDVARLTAALIERVLNSEGPSREICHTPGSRDVGWLEFASEIVPIPTGEYRTPARLRPDQDSKSGFGVATEWEEGLEKMRRILLYGRNKSASFATAGEGKDAL